MPLVRASSLDLFMNCAGWLGLITPRGQKLADDEFINAKTAKKWGTMVHSWKETGRIFYESEDEKEQDKEQTALYSRIYKHKLNPLTLWPRDGFHEVAMAYNWKYRYSILNYGVTDDSWRENFDNDWITGKCDYYRNPQGRRLLWCDDLKTGKWWDKQPDRSAQIVFYGLALWRSGYFEEIDSMRLTVTHWPKYPASRGPVRLEARVTTEQLLRFENNLIKACEIAGTVFNPSPNRCKFCPGRHDCLHFMSEDEYQYRQVMGQ